LLHLDCIFTSEKFKGRFGNNFVDEIGKSCVEPSGAIDFGSFENLLVHHPYKKIGSKNIDAAAKFLCDIAAQANFPYVGKSSSQIPIVTAVGTLKYSVLVPESMNAGNLANKKKIFVVEIKGLKDFLRRNDCRQS